MFQRFTSFLNAYYCSVLIYLLLFSLTLHAENSPEQLYFNTLRQENGLPSNVTNSIVQDSMGFIWIGTGNGICRYDGYSTTIFKNESNNELLPSNNISCLLLDGDNLWIGTWKGLCYINTKTFKIHKVNIGPETAIRCLYKSMDQNIWIGTSKGILVYDKKNERYDFFDSQNSSLSHSTIRCFYQTKDSTMWIGTYDKLNKFKNNTFTSYDLKGKYKPYLKNNLILDICPLSNLNDSILLVGTETGLAIFNSISGTNTLYNNNNTNLSNEVIKCIHPRNNKLWLGTDFGLCIFDRKTKTADSYFHNPIVNHSITNNVIWDIFEDDNHVIWLLTSNGISIINQEHPLFKLHEDFFTINNQKVGNQIRDILIGKDKTLYLATIHGVIAVDNNTGVKTFFTSQSDKPHKLLLDNTYNMIEDQYGKIWIATAGGINVWNPKNARMYAISSTRSNGLTSNYINNFAVTNDSIIWVTAWEGGIFKITGNTRDPENLHFIKVENATPNYIYACNKSLYYINSNKLWKINNSTLSAETVQIVNDSLQYQSLLCMNSQNKNSLWIVTDSKIYNYHPDKNTIKSYPIKNPVIKNPLTIEVDDKNTIWISTINSVIRYDLNKQNIIAEPLNPNFPLKNFYNRCGTISPKGTIYFGGDNGYVETLLTNNIKTMSAPKAVISLIRINNEITNSETSPSLLKQDIAYTKKIKLQYSSNSITFFFTTLNYWLPDKSNYQYRLNGYDEDWKISQDGNFATYANLRPGNYTLEVQSTNYTGLKSPHPTCLQVEILPPVWLSLPMVSFYILFLLALIYFIFRIYVKRQKLNDQLKLVNLEKTHSQEIFNSKQQFFTNISHEFRTPLSLITPPIQQIIESNILTGKNLEMLKLAEKNSKRLLKLVNQILDFRKLETQNIPIKKEGVDLITFCNEIYESFKDIALRNEITYHFISGLSHLTTWIDKEKTEAILYNLISNAFKHTPPKGNISISITFVPDEIHQDIHIAIEDNGSGITEEDLPNVFNQFYQAKNAKEPQQGTGIGLAMAKQYALLHNGDISVKSIIEKGSIFTYSFPIQQLSNSEIPSQEKNHVQNYSAEIKDSFPENNKQKPTILIIDDNPDILDYIEMNLNHEFYIYKASNGKNGFDKTLELIPSLIISDIMMPVMDGLEMCRKIKENETTRHIPVILLTAKSLDIQKTEGIESGANMYITKPFDIHFLHACINSILKREKELYNYIRKELIILPESAENILNNQDEVFLRKVMEIIADNISNPELSVDMISLQIGLSSTHLYRKLKTITNLSTKDILKNYRMQKAAQMIKNKEGNITEIMYHVGFNSLSSFSKSFKSTFGVSPKDYL